MQYTIIVPAKKPIILYILFDFGIISSNTTNNIVPAAKDKNTPIKDLKIPAKYTPKKLPIPIGIPAINVNKIILLAGTLAPAKLRAVAKPSGILCNAITIARVIPSVSADIKDEPIASPSGKLCNSILINIKYPDFMSPAKSSLLFINIVSNTPIKVNTTV